MGLWVGLVVGPGEDLEEGLGKMPEKDLESTSGEGLEKMPEGDLGEDPEQSS